MPPCEPWICHPVVPGVAFSWITQRASTPSGPAKVAGPEAAAPVAVLVPALAGLVPDFGGVACVDLGAASTIPTMATSATITVTTNPPMTRLSGNALASSPLCSQSTGTAAAGRGTNDRNGITGTEHMRYTRQAVSDGRPGGASGYLLRRATRPRRHRRKIRLRRSAAVWQPAAGSGRRWAG